MPLRSCVCTQEQLGSALFQEWAARMRLYKPKTHRKPWEFCFIAQALQERGMLVPGRRGLGFGVGREPLPALFAGMGCEVLATDLRTEDAAEWAQTNQHAGALADLERPDLCEPALFRERTSFRAVDMRRIPEELVGRFDFAWSACSLDHLGSLDAGKRFIFDSLRCLKPGGVAVHTTEYNLSNDKTIEQGQTVLYRRRDIERLATELGERGYIMAEPDFFPGNLPGDRYVDPPPWTGKVSLKVEIGGYAATSIGLIIEVPGWQ